jgi:hypothetical protein
MGSTAYLGNALKPKQHRICYTSPEPIFQYEFNGDACLAIRVTILGNFTKYGNIYVFICILHHFLMGFQP